MLSPTMTVIICPHFGHEAFCTPASRHRGVQCVPSDFFTTKLSVVISLLFDSTMASFHFSYRIFIAMQWPKYKSHRDTDSMATDNGNTFFSVENALLRTG